MANKNDSKGKPKKEGSKSQLTIFLVVTSAVIALVVISFINYKPEPMAKTEKFYQDRRVEVVNEFRQKELDKMSDKEKSERNIFLQD